MFRILILSFFLILSPQAHFMNVLEQAYHNKGEDYSPRTKHINKQGRAKFVNHLILESSPYLLQHAHNPVFWYGFSDEAFIEAKKVNKPIFISIGYATCHWCHVMEEESFDDLEVADFLNQNFISIKVDREIRPDVDATYMGVSQLINGSGGWPLNAVILPNGKAFFAGTYFPKSQLLEILSKITTLWKNEKNKIINQANEIERILNNTNHKTKSSIDKNIITKTIQALIADFDELEGGFGQAPKFPHESILLLLIDEQKRHPNKPQLNAITITLDAMASGGLYDIVGGGFHRYATDNSWLVPHFEKMLYNQAQLSLVYTRAYELTKNPLYQRIAEQTLDYVLTEMKNPDGGFFSATDADSQGEEGTFFVWSVEEIKNILNKDEFERFNHWFDLSVHTDFEGKHIIRFKHIESINQADYPKIDKLLTKLYKARIKRDAPLTDHKILLSWNALMVPSLLEAGAAFNQPKYTQAGLKLANYLQSFNKNEQLYRVSINNKLQTLALFEDYIYLANAYLSVFDHSAQKIWLDKTLQLLETMNKKFWDKENFGFNIGSDNKYINNSRKEIYDGALPSPNGLAYQVLVKLNNRTTDKHLQTQKEQLENAFASQINQAPDNYSSFILGLNDATFGELSSVQYAYNGRIRIHTELANQQININLNLQPLWHINANQPLQSSLIATKITNPDPKNWTFEKIIYPPAELVQLGFSKEKISVYKNQATIKLNLTQRSDTYQPPNLSLTLQACSDKVCLPPITKILKP